MRLAAICIGTAIVFAGCDVATETLNPPGPLPNPPGPLSVAVSPHVVAELCDFETSPLIQTGLAFGSELDAFASLQANIGSNPHPFNVCRDDSNVWTISGEALLSPRRAELSGQIVNAKGGVYTVSENGDSIQLRWYDRDGNLEWTRNLDVGTRHVPMDLRAEPVYVPDSDTGLSHLYIHYQDRDPAQSQNGQPSGLVKVDPAGDVVWNAIVDDALTVYSATYTTSRTVAEHPDGGALVYFTPNIYLDTDRSILVRLGPDGDLRWRKEFNRQDVNSGGMIRNVAVGPSGEIYTVMWSYGQSTHWHDIAKLDASGRTIARTRLNGVAPPGEIEHDFPLLEVHPSGWVFGLAYNRRRKAIPFKLDPDLRLTGGTHVDLFLPRTRHPLVQHSPDEFYVLGEETHGIRGRGSGLVVIPFKLRGL